MKLSAAFLEAVSPVLFFGGHVEILDERSHEVLQGHPSCWQVCFCKFFPPALGSMFYVEVRKAHRVLNIGVPMVSNNFRAVGFSNGIEVSNGSHLPRLFG